MENGAKMTNVKCDNCQRVIFQRQGNTLIAYGIALDLKRSHDIWCQSCESPTRFSIDRDKSLLLNNGNRAKS